MSESICVVVVVVVVVVVLNFLFVLLCFGMLCQECVCIIWQHFSAIIFSE